MPVYLFVNQANQSIREQKRCRAETTTHQLAENLIMKSRMGKQMLQTPNMSRERGCSPLEYKT
jgi:hypothetical protein